MSFKITGLSKLNEVIDARIRSKSEQIVNKYEQEFAAEITSRGEAWAKEVRTLLSVQNIRVHGFYPPNRTLWPKRRTGALMRSIVAPRITVQRHANNGRIWKRDIKFVIDTTWQGAASTYGADLSYDDRFSDSPFFGWQFRARHLLIERLTRDTRAFRKGY